MNDLDAIREDVGSCRLFKHTLRAAPALARVVNNHIPALLKEVVALQRENAELRDLHPNEAVLMSQIEYAQDELKLALSDSDELRERVWAGEKINTSLVDESNKLCERLEKAKRLAKMVVGIWIQRDGRVRVASDDPNKPLCNLAYTACKVLDKLWGYWREKEGKEDDRANSG